MYFNPKYPKSFTNGEPKSNGQRFAQMSEWDHYGTTKTGSYGRVQGYHNVSWKMSKIQKFDRKGN